MSEDTKTDRVSCFFKAQGLIKQAEQATNDNGPIEGRFKVVVGEPIGFQGSTPYEKGRDLEGITLNAKTLVYPRGAKLAAGQRIEVEGHSVELTKIEGQSGGHPWVRYADLVYVGPRVAALVDHAQHRKELAEQRKADAGAPKAKAAAAGSDDD